VTLVRHDRVEPGLGLRRIGDVRVTADNRQELEHDRIIARAGVVPPLGERLVRWGIEPMFSKRLRRPHGILAPYA
jgi:hypothetical protein